MNLLDIFLNGGQMKAPWRNFARFLLILFIFWSLIIRTCYQSMLYELLQSDLRKTPIKSIEDIAKKNFSVYTVQPQDSSSGESIPVNDTSSMRLFKDSRFCGTVAECLALTVEPTQKSVLLLPEYVLSFTTRQYRSGESSFHALYEAEGTHHVTAVFRSFFPFLEEFNEVIGNTVSFGFNWLQQESFEKHAQESVEHQVLTMDHLEVAFIACLIPLVMSIIAFIAEVSIHAVKVTIPRIIFYRLLEEFYNIKGRIPASAATMGK